MVLGCSVPGDICGHNAALQAKGLPALAFAFCDKQRDQQLHLKLSQAGLTHLSCEQPQTIIPFIQGCSSWRGHNTHELPGGSHLGMTKSLLLPGPPALQINGLY